MPPRIFIVAGDPSGDRYAARLMAEWRRLQPEVEFLGIGGSRMEAQGLRSLVPLQRISVVGFWEVARQVGFFRRLLRQCEDVIRTQGVHAVVLVDYPGFNLRLARRVRRRGIPVYYYIAPQVWAWGRWRLAVLAEAVTLLLVVFPFELEFFQRAGVRCTFVGHPLLDEPMLEREPPPVAERPLQIALLPGSRLQELRSHVPLLQRTVELVQRELPEARFVAALPPTVAPEALPAVTHWNWEADVYGLLQRSRAGLVKVGTSTLEAALCGMPFVAFYRMSWLSYAIARSIVQLRSAVLVNLLAGRSVVPEFLQQRAKPAQLARALLEVLEPAVAERQQESFLQLRTLLGGPGTAARAAALLVEELAAHLGAPPRR